MNSLVTLFCGAGGLDLGFHMNRSYKLSMANEILEKPLTSYSKNLKMPLIPMDEFLGDESAAVLGDVQEFNFSIFDSKDTDVVVGGPPCQDFSVLRGKSKRQGIEVKRGKLYSHYVRALVHVQPKVFVFENVPGLLTANKGKAYEVIAQDFENLSIRWDEVKKLVNNGEKLKIDGYELIFSSIVKMTDLGVPQGRRRLIIIGIRKDQIKDVGILFDLENTAKKILKGTNNLFSNYPLTPIEVLEGDTLENLNDEYSAIMKDYDGVWKDVNNSQGENWKKTVWNNLSFDIFEDYKILNKIKNFSEENLERALTEHKKVLKMLGYYKRPVENEVFEDGSNDLPKEQRRVLERMERIPPGFNFKFVEGTKWQVKGLMSGIYRRIHPLIPSATVIAYGGGGTWGYHYRRNRGVMTNRERARLQTFPDWYMFEGSRQDVRAQIGEAVPPLASYNIAEAVEEILEKIN